MPQKVEGLINAALVVCAIAIAVSVVSRTFFPQLSAQSAPRDMGVVAVKSWKDAFPIGVRSGPLDAPVTVVELSDFECPGCKAFHRVLRSVLTAYPRDIADVYVYQPLSQHRFALGAARGAECATRTGKFWQWANVIYDKQDSLGLKSWGGYAKEAGIADTTAMIHCANNPAPVARIRDGLALGARLHIQSTPTIIVNGYLMDSAPDSAELAAMIAAVRLGADPFAGRVHLNGGER